MLACEQGSGGARVSPGSVLIAQVTVWRTGCRRAVWEQGSRLEALGEQWFWKRDGKLARGVAVKRREMGGFEKYRDGGRCTPPLPCL